MPSRHRSGNHVPMNSVIVAVTWGRAKRSARFTKRTLRCLIHLFATIGTTMISFKTIINHIKCTDSIMISIKNNNYRCITILISLNCIIMSCSSSLNPRLNLLGVQGWCIKSSHRPNLCNNNIRHFGRHHTHQPQLYFPTKTTKSLWRLWKPFTQTLHLQLRFKQLHKLSNPPCPMSRSNQCQIVIRRH